MMGKVSGFGVFVTGFAGLIFSIMCAIMCASGTVNFDQFFSNGEICELSQADLRTSSPTMVYNQELQQYDLVKKACKKKYIPSGKEEGWKYICVAIDNMSAEIIEGYVVGYDKDKQEVWRVPVNWVWGKNYIQLDETIPVYGVSVEFRDAKNGYVSIQSIQFGNKDFVFIKQRFIVAFAAAFVVYSVTAGFVIYRIKNIQNNNKRITRYVSKIPDEIYREIDLFWEERIGTKKRLPDDGLLAVILFFVFFGIMILGNIKGWCENTDVYRYYVLTCMILIFFICAVCCEKGKRVAAYDKKLLYSWMGLAFWMLFSNLFVTNRLYRTGILLLLTGASLFHTWHKMRKPFRLYASMIYALECLYVPIAAVCMVCRGKYDGIYYNGIFCDSESFAMFCAMMGVLFFNEIIQDCQKGRPWLLYASHALCLGSALYFLKATESVTGIIGMMLAVGIVILCKSSPIIYGFSLEIKRQWMKYLCILVLTGAGVLGTQMATENVPFILHSNIEYENEDYVTGLPWQEIENIKVQNELKGEIKSAEALELPVIRRNLLWKVNMFGHGSALKVFREQAQPYSDVLTMIYRYGWFITVPYAAFWMALWCKIINDFRQKNMYRQGGNVRILAAAITVIYFCFSVYGNPGQEWAHPLWFLFYIGNGILFLRGDGQKRE